MDSRLELPADGTLPWVTPCSSKPAKLKNNIMIIKVPEHLRSPSDPIFELATIDRSIPGDDFYGNKILDKIYPNLPKVTLFEEPKPKDDTPSPKTHIETQEVVPPFETKEIVSSRPSRSNAGGKPRRYYSKTFLPKRSDRPNADEISSWILGNESYISHGNRCNSTSPLITRSEPCEMANRPESDSFGSHREKYPLPEEYPSNFRSFGNVPPQPSKYPMNKYTNRIMHLHQRLNPNSRGRHPVNNTYREVSKMGNKSYNTRDFANQKQQCQSKTNYRKIRYFTQGNSHTQRRTFPNTARSSETQMKESSTQPINEDSGNMHLSESIDRKNNL